MSAKTFYLAASSANVEQARARIADLESMGWTCLYDWTPLDKPESEWPEVSQDEIDAVLDADVFVALAPVSPGAAFEIGVRVTSNYMAAEAPAAHLVGPWVCPFAHSPSVIRHATWDDFIAALSGGER